MPAQHAPELAPPAKKPVSGIKSWAEDDRPREKMMLKGMDALSNAELVAILLRTGQTPDTALDLAKSLLETVNQDLHLLSRLSLGELTRLRGLGNAKAISVLAALELGRRKDASLPVPKRFIAGSADAASILRPRLADLRHEVFLVMFLSQANKINHLEVISSGGLASTSADPRLIMRKVLEHDASKLILCHNHPSGNLVPSPSDLEATQCIKKAAALFGVRVLDHLIVSSEGHYSFADHGQL